MSSSTTRTFNGVAPPAGETITYKDGKLVTPSQPIIPYIDGDGIGPDISRAMRKVIDAGVFRTYGDKRKINWFEVYAGGKAKEKLDNWLPDDTIAALREYKVGIKGPMTTPTGVGNRSLNVRLRQTLDLYACIRPVRYYDGVPSVMKEPGKLDLVIYRENTEDIYTGLEFAAGSDGAKKVAAVLAELGTIIGDDAGIGIKVISKKASRRIIRDAIKYAIESGRKRVTMVHKGNIQKYTEGAFCLWGYELAAEEFADKVVVKDDFWSKHNGVLPEGKVLLTDIIADAAFHDLLVRPEDFSVIVTMNLNGDYLSDSTAGEVGGLGIAPGANVGDTAAIFEATHGTAQSLADKNVANPGSLILSAVLMLRHIGWTEAADAVATGFAATITAKSFTGDLARLVPGVKALSTTEFADAIIANIPAAAATVTDTVSVVPVATDAK